MSKNLIYGVFNHPRRDQNYRHPARLLNNLRAAKDHIANSETIINTCFPLITTHFVIFYKKHFAFFSDRKAIAKSARRAQSNPSRPVIVVELIDICLSVLKLKLKKTS